MSEFNIEVVEKVEVVQTLENIILNKLLEKINDKNFMIKIKLNDSELNIINVILKNHPKILDEICLNVSTIIKDKILDTNDIPSIILLCKNIFNVYVSSNKIKLTKKEIVDFIKNIVIILVESEIVNTNDKALILAMINLSIQLLETKIDLKKKCILKFW